MRGALILTATVWLCACASGPEPVAETSRPASSLGPRPLQAGQCGLYVWTADPARRFIGFVSDASSDLFVDGREVSATASGTIPNLLLTTSDTQYRLSLSRPERIAEGLRYLGGTLKSDARGGERVQPVVGLSTCAELARIDTVIS